MSVNPKRKMNIDLNNINEVIMYLLEEVSSLRTEIRWIKYTLYVMLLLLSILLGLRVV